MYMCDIHVHAVFFTGFSQDKGVVKYRAEFPTTLKLLCSTYSQIKGDCSLKALKVKLLKCTGENTNVVIYYCTFRLYVGMYTEWE